MMDGRAGETRRTVEDFLTAMIGQRVIINAQWAAKGAELEEQMPPPTPKESA